MVGLPPLGRRWWRMARAAARRDGARDDDADSTSVCGSAAVCLWGGVLANAGLDRGRSHQHREDAARTTLRPACAAVGARRLRPRAMIRSALRRCLPITAA